MRRVLAVVAALSLTVAAACADAEPPGDVVIGPQDSAPPESPDSPAGDSAPGDTERPSGGQDDADDDAGAAQPGRTSATPPPPPGTASSSGGVNDGGRVGSAGSALLSPWNPSVVVEIDRSPGASLTVDAAAVLGEELREHGGKQQIRRGGDSEVPRKEVYTAADLRAITEDHRVTRSSPEEPGVYVLVLGGRFENERATGVAFAATAFAIFPEQLGGGLLGTQRGAFETAVLVHELGHLFGLVNLTGQGEFHEDPDHPGHSRYQSSVMYWAIEDISLRTVFEGGPPTEFDRYDREEMSRIRSS